VSLWHLVLLCFRFLQQLSHRIVSVRFGYLAACNQIIHNVFGFCLCNVHRSQRCQQSFPDWIHLCFLSGFVIGGTIVRRDPD
jgi:hypothetical protein